MAGDRCRCGGSNRDGNPSHDRGKETDRFKISTDDETIATTWVSYFLFKICFLLRFSSKSWLGNLDFLILCFVGSLFCLRCYDSALEILWVLCFDS